MSKSNSKSSSFLARHRGLSLLLSLLLISFLSFLIWLYIQSQQNKTIQTDLEPFYTPPPLSANNKPGDMLRIQPLSITIPNGKGYRILYVSEFSNGQKVVSSGMIFIPTDTPPSTNRKIVTWAHGTIGMGDACAPSRTANPLTNIPWVAQMMQRGWIVTATDYYGLGTPGTERYLIGDDQSRDVINAVRAVRNISDAHASNQFAVFGHSQGGQAALFTANIAATYAPELHVVGVTAAAPAAELPALFDQQYKQAVTWIIGPEVAVGWPQVYPNLDFKENITTAALNNYQQIATTCVLAAVPQAIIRTDLKQNFFKKNPVTIPAWYHALSEQIPPTVSAKIPVMIVQSLTDTVVLPNTTALYIQNSCNNGSNLTTTWINNVSHDDTAKVIGPFVVSWLEQRFENKPTEPTCNQPLPVTPAQNPSL